MKRGSRIRKPEIPVALDTQKGGFRKIPENENREFPVASGTQKRGEFEESAVRRRPGAGRGGTRLFRYNVGLCRIKNDSAYRTIL